MSLGSAISSSAAAAFSFARAPRARICPGDLRDPPRFRIAAPTARRSRRVNVKTSSRPSRSSTDRAGDRSKHVTHRGRAIPHPRLPLLDELGELAPLPSQHLDPARGQRRVGRDTSHPPRSRSSRSEPPAAEIALPCCLHDQRACQLRHRLRADPPGELADGRLVRHPLRERDPANRRRIESSPTPGDQRPVTPPIALLERDQPDVGLHRVRRPPPPTPTGRSVELAVGSARPAAQPLRADRPNRSIVADPPALLAARPAPGSSTMTPATAPTTSREHRCDQRTYYQQGILGGDTDGNAPQAPSRLVRGPGASVDQANTLRRWSDPYAKTAKCARSPGCV